MKYISSTDQDRVAALEADKRRLAQLLHQLLRAARSYVHGKQNFRLTHRMWRDLTEAVDSMADIVTSDIGTSSEDE